MLRHSIIAVCLALLASQVAAQDESAAARVLELSDVDVSVIAADGSQAFSNSGSFPATLLQSPQLGPQHTLQVEVSITANGEQFKPQQVFLALRHKQTGVSAYAVGKAKKDNSYSLSASASLIEKQIGKQAGYFEVFLLVGDPTAPAGVQWALGAVELLSADADTSSPQVRTASVQPVSNSKPVITHAFRPAEKRPPVAISMVFTGLVFVPLVAVIGYVLFGLKANFNGWPKSGPAALYMLAFHALLAALLGLYLLFWTKWNLAQTLPVALALGAALTVVGNRGLSSLAAARLSSKKD